MRKYLGEKYNKFSLRKLTVGVCSMTIGSFFLMSTVQPEDYIVKAADNAIVHYKYVGEDKLTDREKELIRKEVPNVVNSTEETYYLVFKTTKTTQLNKLPNTGLNYGVGSMLLGGMLGLLVVAVAKGKNKTRKILSILLVTSMGATTLELPVRAMEDLQLSVYNMDYNLKVGDKLPEISAIPGYSFVGFIKNEAETKIIKEDSKENVISQQNENKQPHLKEITNTNVIDKKQETKTTLTNTDKKEDKKVLENNNKKENKKVIENTNKNEDRKVLGVNTVNLQDEVLAGKLTKPELLYTDKIVETPIQYNQVIENNNQLPEGTTRVKQHGKVGKKTEVIRVFTVEGKEVSKELISTNTKAPVSEIIEKGTKKAVSTITPKGEKLVKPTVEVKPEYKGVQAGAIVEPAKAEPPKEYTGVQAGAIVEPEKVEPQYGGVTSGALVEPEKVEPPKEYTGVQAGAIVEPEKAEAPKEYRGVQAGAIVEPAKAEASKEYTGVQAGAIVEPEKIEPPKEFTGKIDPLKTEDPKPTVENNNTAEINNVQKNASALLRMNFVRDKQEQPAIGSATFIAPNVLLTVSHNFISNSKDNTTGEFIGDKAKNTYEWQTPDGQKGSFTSEDIHFYNQKDYPKGFIYDLAVITLPQSTRRQHANLVENYSKVNVNDKLNVYGYPRGEYTHLKETTVEMEQKYANNTYGVQYQGGKAGMSGGGIFNSKGEVIGIHQNGAENRSGGLILSPTQLAWIRSIINGKEITPKYDALERHKDEKKDETKEDKEVIKKLELRNISSVELYSKEDNKYRHVTSLNDVPSDSTKYFMKVKSENFKDIMLPVTEISNSEKDGKEVYKIVARANNLIQHENNNVLENYTYYLPKSVKSEKGVYTSFKNLVVAMNNDPRGTFRLGATMDAREVELLEGQESYIGKEFSGKLIGENKGKYYAIYNLKKPLFNTLSHATIQDLSIKEANVSSKEDAATIAKMANNSTVINNVHSSGVIAGERSIGGLVSQVDNSTISNSSFTGRITNTYESKSSYQIGGLVGKLSGAQASISKSISSIDMATNANKGDQIVGGIAGVVDKKATILNSYVEGNVNNVKQFGNVGGVVGNLWANSGEVENSGRLSDVLSDVNVTNGNAISGYDFRGIKETNIYSNKNKKVVNVVQEDDEVVTKDSDVQRGTVLEADIVKEKKAKLVSRNNTKVEDFDFTSRYTTNYNEVTGYQQSREQVYKNIEKLLPFYNRETIVKYGNLVEDNSDLFTKKLLSVVPMKNNEVITDINKSKREINKLLLHFEGNKSQVLNITYKDDFSKVAEYDITNTKLMYTPNTLLHNYNHIVTAVLNDLKSVQYNSDSVRKVLDISNDIKLTELYLDEQFDKTKANIEDSLSKLLSADAAVAENNNKIIDNYVIEKIKNNKEALLLGLTYLERWYNFKYDNASAKDLVLYYLDFFGKSNSSALDNVIELGKSGFNNLLAKNNVITYNVLLSKNYGTESLFKALEGYRKVFLPNVSNNDWFKKQSKAYIVEEKSNIKEVREKQSEQGTEYSIGVYDRLTSPSWKYQSMVLPLLTLPEEKMVFMIANISTIGFGAYDRYRSLEYPKGEKLNKFVEDNAKESAKRFRDHYDYWYKILDDKNKEKLYRSVLVYDAFRFGTDEMEDKTTYQANFETNHPAIKHFFGPAGNNVVHNKHGAYATGDAFYYMSYRMLDKSGAVTYTHEMTHNSDREIYLGGYGRRSGLGPEFYAKGLLQAPDHPDDPTITINSVLKYDEAENANRLQVEDPTQRFSSAEDLHKYMHNMFDVIYMLEYLEGKAVAKLNVNQKNDLLRKVENKFKRDQDGNDVYATNVVRRLTMDEINKLNSFDSLIENDIITSRGYKDQEYMRNGYYTINLFSPIYSALSGEKGTPGDLMGRRMAFELLAAKGYQEGMVPYISNQYEKEAKDRGSKINSYGKEIGLVTDDLVLEKVFNKKYASWKDFKRDMYRERENKFSKLNRVNFFNPNEPWGRQRNVTISDISVLERMIEEAVQADAEDDVAKLYPDTNSRVLKLKKAIFKAYLDKTKDFRTSIFGEE